MRALLVLVLALPLGATTVAQIAGFTTIAVNAPTIIKFARHPKRGTKAAAKKVKETVTGKPNMPAPAPNVQPHSMLKIMDCPYFVSMGGYKVDACQLTVTY